MNQRSSHVLGWLLIAASFNSCPAFAVDAHQVVVPQVDGNAIEPEHRAHVLAEPTRDFRLERETTTWIVFDRAPSRSTAGESRAAPRYTELLFAFDKSLPISWEPLLQWLPLVPNTVSDITLVGYADERGSDAYNVELSRKRALAVRQRIASLGIPASAIQIVAKGKSALESPGDGQRNRRVEVSYDAATDGGKK